MAIIVADRSDLTFTMDCDGMIPWIHNCNDPQWSKFMAENHLTVENYFNQGTLFVGQTSCQLIMLDEVSHVE